MTRTNETPPTIAICLISGGLLTTDFAMSLIGMLGYSMSRLPVSVFCEQSCFIHRNRNCVTKQSIDNDAVASFHIDTDVMMPPDTLLRLMSHDKDIVGACYSYKCPGGGPVGKTLDGLPLREHGLREMEYMGMGCVLIKTEVFQKIQSPWFNVTGGPTLHDVVGEDMNFFELARASGYTAWCDQDLSYDLGHIGQHVFKLDRPV